MEGVRCAPRGGRYLPDRRCQCRGFAKAVAAEPSPQNRKADLALRRVAAQAGRQIGPCRVDGGLNIAGGAVDVAIEIELQRDAREAKGIGRRDLRYGRDLAET